MNNYKDDKWLTQNNWGKWGENDEVGVLNEVTPKDVIEAAKYIKNGKVYDLETLRFKGMPVWNGHVGFELLTYASPRGRQTMANSDYDPAFSWMAKGGWLEKDTNEYKVAANTEIMIAPLHMGTHIDGFSHITVGEDNHWYNGYNEKEHWTDFGPLKAEGSTIPPIVTRGVLLDIAGYKGVAHLQPQEAVTMEDVIGCEKWEGVEIRPGDTVLLRMGERWPQMDLCPDAGVTIDAARYLVEERKVVLLGDDMVAFENFPRQPGNESSVPGHAHPVHHYLLIQQGVHFIELCQLDELAYDKAYEFCFIVTPAKIKGSTGMFVRPIAIT